MLLLFFYLAQLGHLGFELKTSPMNQIITPTVQSFGRESVDSLFILSQRSLQLFDVLGSPSVLIPPHSPLSRQVFVK